MVAAKDQKRSILAFTSYLGNVAELEAGLKHAQNCVTRDDAHDVAVGDYGQLSHFFLLHSFQDSKGRFFG